MSSDTIEQQISSSTSRATGSLLQNLGVLAFGLAVILAVGFLPMSAAHNAAHDTRHTLAFPCH